MRRAVAAARPSARSCRGCSTAPPRSPIGSTAMSRLRAFAPRLRTHTTTRLKAPRSEGSAHPLYGSREWRLLANRIKRERGNRCEDPEHWPGHPRTGVRIYADHVVELSDGGAALDERNILLRCPRCHSRKTMIERAKRR